MARLLSALLFFRLQLGQGCGIIRAVFGEEPKTNIVRELIGSVNGHQTATISFQPRTKQFNLQMLQSSRHEKRSKFQDRRHLAEETRKRFASLCVSIKAIRTASREIRREVFCILNSCLTAKQRHGTRTSPILCP